MEKFHNSVIKHSITPTELTIILMKKKVFYGVFTIALLASIAYGGYWYFLKPVDNIRPIYLVPKDAIYIIETTEPISNWQKISNSDTWKHLQKNAYFAELTSSANYLDTLIKENQRVFDWLGSRTVLISAHMYKADDYDFLYVVDLEKVSQFGALQRYLESIVGDVYKITRRTFREVEIIEMYDPQERETLYLSFVQNLLLVSYKHNLIEAAIEQKDLPVIGRDFSFIDIDQQISGKDMFRLYFQYNYLDDYMRCYTNSPDASVTALSNWLKFTGVSFKMEEDVLSMEGYTNLNDTANSYINALINSENGSTDILKISPQRTAFYLGLGFSDFETFFDNIEQSMSKDEKGFKAYKENMNKLEKFLEIDIKEHFISWIDNELAFVQSKPTGLGDENEFALVLKTKDAKIAKEKLRFVGTQIRKQTPVKFKEVVYRNYPIRFMSVKGFFKLILGDFFSKLEKPYYTIIDDYVVFSNHPQTIKNFIDDYVDQNTLGSSEEFKAFQSSFSKKSNAFVYINSPTMVDNLKGFVDNETWASIQENKQFITCFSDLGLQLIKDGKQFKTLLTTRYKDPEKVQQMLAEQAALEQVIGPNPQVTLDDILVDAIIAFRDISPDSLDLEEMISIDGITLDDLDAKKHQAFFEDGKTLKLEVYLKDGLKHGSYREYHESGTLKVKGKYKNDKPTGIWRFYDESGKRTRKERY